MASFMSYPHHHVIDGPSQHRPPLPPGHCHIADVANGQKQATLVDTSERHVTLDIA
jgi:hypothetical protein